MFCGDHRLPEKHNCVGLNAVKNPSYNPPSIHENYRNSDFTPANQYYKKKKPERKIPRLNIPRIFENKLVIGLIVLCLIGTIGYYDYSSNQSNLYNTYIAPIANVCIDGISSFIDPYYDTPYYKYALITTESSGGKTTDVYETYPNGTTCYVTNYKNATNPSYSELVNFLKYDQTEQQAYIENVYVCANFATRLHDNAESKNIKAYIVTVVLIGSSGHMIVGFNTTDRGWVYIDDTGLTNDLKQKGCPSTDTYVNLNCGGDYLPIDIIPGASGNWHHENMGIIAGYDVWEPVENYNIWNSLKYR
jgi:hypothetical protein